jgi:TonB family protein
MTYRLVFVLVIFSVSVWRTTELTAAAESIGSKTELSERIVGQWESKLRTKKIAPLKTVFVSMDLGKHFKLIRVYEFGGRQGRIEYDGNWRVSNGELVWEVSEARSSEGSQSFKGIQKQRILSVANDLVVLRAADGSERDLKRMPIPSQLPPLLPRGALEKAVILSAPKIEYPIQARRKHLQGEGMFCLNVNDKTGAVSSVEVWQSTGHRILDEAAIGRLKNWRFKPQAVVRWQVPVDFRMNSSGVRHRMSGAVIPD